jgi:hypothetical protein
MGALHMLLIVDLPHDFRQWPGPHGTARLLANRLNAATCLATYRLPS